jgi:hypothetical protein
MRSYSSRTPEYSPPSVKHRFGRRMFSGGDPDTHLRFLREWSFRKCVVTEAKAPKHRVNLNGQNEAYDWRSTISVRGLFIKHSCTGPQIESQIVTKRQSCSPRSHKGIHRAALWDSRLKKIQRYHRDMESRVSHAALALTSTVAYMGRKMARHLSLFQNLRPSLPHSGTTRHDT